MPRKTWTLAERARIVALLRARATRERCDLLTEMADEIERGEP